MAVPLGEVDIWRIVEKKLLTCSICGNLFTDPKTIPCLHTFCERCLEGSVSESSDSVSCPLCRQLLNDSIDSIAIDSNIQRLQEVFVQQQTHGLLSVGDVVCACGKCEQSHPSITWCVDCQTSLCESCSEEHSSCSSTIAHTTEAMKEFLSNPLALLPSMSTQFSLDQPGFCSSHPQHMLHLFCTTCNCLVCLDCVLKDHRRHVFTTSDVLLP